MLPHTRAYDSSHHKVLRRERRDGPFPGEVDYLEFLNKFVDPHKLKTAFDLDASVAIIKLNNVIYVVIS